MNEAIRMAEMETNFSEAESLGLNYSWSRNKAA
jgi:hypothetical protein